MKKVVVQAIPDGASEPKTRAGKPKLPYIPTQRASEKMSEEQKEGIRIWNLMVNTLRDNGLMEEKK